MIKERNTEMRRLFIFLLVILFMSAAFVPTVSAQCCDGGDCCIQNDCWCPMCWDRGEPGGICEHCGSDLCPECGNCHNCGQSPCPTCRTTCLECGGPFCDHCGGCLDCGHGRDSECPFCGNERNGFFVDIDDLIDEDELSMDSDGLSEGDEFEGDELFVGSDDLIEEDELLIDSDELPGSRSGLFFLDDFSDLIPLASIWGTEVFLFAPFGVPVWVITNLVAGITGGLLLAIATLRIILYKRKENMRTEAELAGINFDESIKSKGIFGVLEKIEAKYTEHRNNVYIAMGFLALLGIVVLVLTQSFRGIVAIFDWWTIIHIMLFAGIIICNRFVFINEDESSSVLT